VVFYFSRIIQEVTKMADKHGITTNTYQRVLMGPGAVYAGVDQAALLGATRGGNVLEINRTFRDIRPDGAKGPVKNFRYLESVDATLTVRLMEITEANVVYALAGSSLATHIVTGGEIVAATYITEISICAEIKGITASTEMSEVRAALTNCLVDGPFTIDLPESGDAIIELRFRAHYDAAALTTEPWKLTFVAVA
jgi:hypothetical protein